MEQLLMVINLVLTTGKKVSSDWMWEQLLMVVNLVVTTVKRVFSEWMWERK
jgi:membrane-anchored protein YejM (alkaline phosphatase superfamily)